MWLEESELWEPRLEETLAGEMDVTWWEEGSVKLSVEQLETQWSED
jgi:hypothetical protein